MTKEEIREKMDKIFKEMIPLMNAGKHIVISRNGKSADWGRDSNALTKEEKVRLNNLTDEYFKLKKQLHKLI